MSRHYLKATLLAAAMLFGAHGAQAQGGAAGAVPLHVLTSIQDLCYTDPCYHTSQRNVPLSRVASMVTWAFADSRNADDARRAGIHTIAYLDPSIQYDPKRDLSPLYTDNETTYLRACDGTRAHVRLGDLDGYFMDQGSPAFRALLAKYVETEVRPHYDALFADDAFAATDSYVTVVAAPCGITPAKERAATFAAWQSAQIPIVFNALGLAPDDGRVSDQAVAGLDGPNVAGAMYEMCLTAYDVHNDHSVDRRRVDGAWGSVENSHLATIAKRKLFFCFAESPVDGATPDGIANRAYTYASFLLAYDPRYSVLQEHLRSARSGIPVYPETQLVAMEPRTSASGNIDELKRGGAYVREFARCYVARMPAGPCAVAVNPAGSGSVPFPLQGYRAALAFHGGSIADGGHVAFTDPIPAVLPAASAVIVVR